MQSCIQVSIFLVIFALASHVSALDCYQCNLECRNGTIQGCENVTLGTNETRVSCDSAEEVSGCMACVKVRTVLRRYILGTDFETVEILSKVCQTQKTLYTEDNCDYNGPAWANNVVCHCYSDLCNSATRALPLAIPLLAIIVHSLL